jgi:hypothetical protein
LSKNDFEYLFSIKVNVVLNQGVYFNNEFQEVYLVRMDVEADKIKFQQEEISEVKFMSITELEKIVSQGSDKFVQHQEEYKKLLQVLSK